MVTSGLELRLVADHRRLEQGLEVVIELLPTADLTSLALLWSDVARHRSLVAPSWREVRRSGRARTAIEVRRHPGEKS